MQSRLDRALSSTLSEPDRLSISRLCGRLLEQGGPLRLVDEEPAGRGQFLRFWSDRLDRGVLLYAAPDPHSPNRLSRLSWLIAVHPQADVQFAPEASRSPEALVDAVSAACEALGEAEQLSGVVLVAAHDRILYHQAFGDAVRMPARPNLLSTRFHQASMGKMFTGVAIAQLVEAGRLGLDERVGDLLPEFPWTMDAAGATVQQLLEHTAGFGMLFDRPGFRFWDQYATSSELVGLFAGAPLLFAPGSRWGYSNEGYEVLGAIIEHRTGLKFLQYVDAHIFRSAGMEATGAALTANDAVAYAAAPDDPFGVEPRVENRRLGRAGGCGGFFGTAEDLLRFASALQRGALIAKDSLEQLTRPRHRYPGPFDDWYGRGFLSFEAGGQRVFGHGGGGPGAGVCVGFSTFADGRFTVITLTNFDPPVGDRLNRAVVNLLASVDPPSG